MSIPHTQLRRPFLLILVVLISALFLWMVRSFLVTLLLAAIFGAMARPLSRRLARRLGGREGLAAVLTMLILLIVVGLPVSAFLGIVAAQAVDISQAARPWIEQQMATPEAWSQLIERIPFLSDYLPAEPDVAAKLGEFAATVGRFLANSMVDVTRGTANFFFQLFIMLYAMFFFMTGGERMMDRILYLVPLDSASEEKLVEKFISVTRAVLKGSLIIGLIQGTLAGLAFWIAGIEGWAFWMTIMIVLSVIPAIGAALIWIPAVIFLFAAGKTVAAILLLIWCGTVVGTVDNFLRPMLVGRDTKMPDLLVLIGTLGGIYLFGAVGFILGPIVAALFLAIWDLYGETFREELMEIPDKIFVSDEEDPGDPLRRSGQFEAE